MWRDLPARGSGRPSSKTPLSISITGSGTLVRSLLQDDPLTRRRSAQTFSISPTSRRRASKKGFAPTREGWRSENIRFIGSPAPVMVGNADVVRPGAHHGSYLKRPDWLLSMIGEFLDAPIALCSDIGPLLLRSSSVGVSGVPNPLALSLKHPSQRWSNFIDYCFIPEAE
jgi:hypothetical protein